MRLCKRNGGEPTELLTCRLKHDDGTSKFWENCDCSEIVEADAKSPHKASDDTAIIAAEYPVGGYAPGGYMVHCTTCGARFTGDKRAWQCESCGRATHAKSDNAAIDKAEKRKLDGQRTAIRRSLEQALERPTNAALQRHIDGLRGYQESVVMELIDRAGALG